MAIDPEQQGQNSGKRNKRQIPVGRRFKPGKSGNPKGRPKGESLTTKINRILDEPDPKHGTKADALIAKAIQQARKGDFRFFKEIIDRRDGKTADRSQNETVVEIRVTYVSPGDTAKPTASGTDAGGEPSQPV